MAHDEPYAGPERRRSVEEGGMPRMPFRFDPGISLGHIIAALPGIVLAVWILSGDLSGNSRQIDNLQKQIDNLTAQVVQSRAELLSRIDDMQKSAKENQVAVRNDIVNIPSMKERVDQLDKRLGETNNRMDAQSARLESVQSETTRNTSDVAGMLRAQAVKIGR